MAPKFVAKRPARRGHGWGDLPVPSGYGSAAGAQLWDFMELWQEGARGIRAASLLRTGHIVEATITSGGGRVLGHIMCCIVAAHPPDGAGVALEVSSCGVSNQRLKEWANTVFTATETPLLHICGGRGLCRFSLEGRVVLHIHRWRVRNPMSIKEPWFVRPLETVGVQEVVAEPADLGAGVLPTYTGGSPLEAAGTEDAALLRRFEQMRGGVVPESDPVEKERGRAEVQAALREEELAAKRHGSGIQGPGQILLDRAAAAVDLEPTHRPKKSRKRARRSSSSGSESIALVDRHG
eukprot:5692031-Amphidinium_carterae.1